MDEEVMYQKNESIVKEFGLSINGNYHQYIERFAAGGMSSGIVTDSFAQEGWK